LSRVVLIVVFREYACLNNIKYSNKKMLIKRSGER